MWLIASALAAPVGDVDLGGELDAIAAGDPVILLLPADIETLAGLRGRTLPVNIRLDPIVLDPTQQATRAANGRGACVYRVAHTELGWELAPLTKCRGPQARPLSGAELGPPPSVGAPTDAAPDVAGAPVAEPTPPVAAAEPTPPEARDAPPATGRGDPPDVSSKLLIFHRDHTVPGGWWVSGPGQQGSLDSVRFATLTLDESRAYAFEVASKRAAAPKIGMGVAGTAGVVAGMALLGAAGPEVRVPNEPDPLSYSSQAEYTTARDSWERSQLGADVRDELITNGAALLALSGICWVTIPFIGGDARAVLRHPGLAWSPGEGRGAVDAYNARVWASVGLGPNGVELTVGLP